MTIEQVSDLIKEELSSFSNKEEGPKIFSVFEKLIPSIVNIFQAHLTNKDSSEELFSLFESYRTNLQASQEHLVSIHLFALIVFDRLEKEATKANDSRLQKIWSDIGDKMIMISTRASEELDL